MSWKKHGGLNSLEQQNNLTVHSITTDFITIRNAFLSVFTIKGDLTVLGDGFFDKSLTLKETLNVRTLDVSQNATIQGSLTMNNSSVLYSTGGNLGINTTTPQFGLDISSSNVQGFSVHTSNANARNILAKNSRGYGLAVSVLDASSTELQFYSGTNTDVSGSPNAKILFDNSDNLLLIDSTGDTKITSNLIIADNRDVGNARTSYNETLLVYDNVGSTTPFFPDAYALDCSSGNAVTLVTIDETAKSYLNIATPNKLGLQIGGGSYPNDTSRSMGIIDVFNGVLDPIATPAMMIISGNTLTKYNATTGFNTFSPKYEDYAVDINGPVHINNGELKITLKPNTQILKMANIGDNAIAIGSYERPNNTYDYYIYNTTNGGKSWSKSANKFTGEITTDEAKPDFNMISRFDTTHAIVGGQTYAFYTHDNILWSRFTDEREKTALFLKTATQLYLGTSGIIKYGQIIQSGANWIFQTPTEFVVIGFLIKSCSGSGNTLAFVGDDQIRVYDTSGNGLTQLFTTHTKSGALYTAISFFNEDYGIAVGTNVISYTRNRGSSWTDINGVSGKFNDVFIFDSLHAVVVGDQGIIYTSLDAGSTWSLVDADTVNASGVGDTLVNPTTNLTSVFMPDLSSFVISTKNTDDTNPKFFYLNMPNIFNNKGNYLLDISGSVKMTGDLHIDGSGSIISNSSVFHLLDEDVATLNIGSEATTVNIGSSTAAINIGGLSYQNQTGNINISNNVRLPNLYTTGNTDICGNLFIYQNADISNNLTVRSSGILTIENTVVSTSTTSGALQVRGGVGIQNNIIIGQTAYVKGNTTTDGILSVQNTDGLTFGIDPSGTNYLPYISGGAFRTIGSGAMMGSLFVNGISRVGDDLYVYGNLYVKNTLTTGGQNNVANVPDPWQGNSLNDANNVSPCLYAKGGLRVDLNTILNGNINVNGTTISATTDTGALQVIGGIGVGGNINVGGTQSVFSNTQASSGTTSGALQVRGGIGVGGNINVGGIQSIFTNTEASIGTTSGAFQVRGGIGVGGNINVGGSQSLFLNTEASSGTASGALQVRGGIGVGGNINVGGIQSVFLNTETSSGTTTGALQVRGGIGVGGNINVGGSQSIFLNTEASIGTTSGALQVRGGIGVGGNIIVGGIQSIFIHTEASIGTTSGALQVRGGIGVGGNINVGGSQSIFTNTELSSGTASGALQVRGGMGLGGNINVGGSQSIFTNTELSSGTASGALQVRGGIGVGGNINVGGSQSIFTNTELSSGTTSGALQVRGGVGVGGNINVGGSQSVFTNTETSIGTTSGALQVRGGIGVGGNINVGGSQSIFTNTETSIGTTSGALQVRGGVGVGGNINLGGRINVGQGQSTFADTTTSTGTDSGSLQVRGGVGIALDTVVGGNVRISSVTASNNRTSGALIVAGGVGVSGNIYATLLNTSEITTGSIYTEALTMNNNGLISVYTSQTDINATGTVSFVGSQIIVKTITASSSVLTGALQIKGGVGIEKNIYVGAGESVFNDTTISTTTVSGALQVRGGIGVGGNINIGGTQSVIFSTTAAISTVSGALQVRGGVGIGGAIIVGGQQSIFTNTEASLGTTSGALQVRGGVGIGGAVSIGTDMTTSSIMGSINIGSSITNAGTTTIHNSLVVNNNFSTNSSFSANIPKIEVNNQATISSTRISSATDDGALRVVGGVGIGGATNIGGITSIRNTLDSTTSADGALVVSGGMGITKNMNVGAAGIVKINNPTASSSTTSGALQVVGGVGIGGAINIGGNMGIGTTGILTLNNPTASGSTASGALQVVGGVGIGGAVNIGGNMGIGTTGILTLNNPTASGGTASGALQVVGGVGIGGAINIGGNMGIGTTGILTLNNPTASGSTASGALRVVGGVGIGGAINIGGNMGIGTTGILTLNNPTASGSTSSGALQVVGGVGIGGAINIGGALNATAGTGQNTLSAIGIGGSNTMIGSSNIIRSADTFPMRLIISSNNYNVDYNANNLMTMNSSSTTLKNDTISMMAMGVIRYTQTSLATTLTNDTITLRTATGPTNKYVHTTTTTTLTNPTINLNGSTAINLTGPIAISGITTSDARINAESFNATSDKRIKQNVSELSSTLPILRELSPKSFQYIDASKNMHDTIYGFIAQEIKAILPNAVSIGTGYLPNIYETAHIDGTTITLTHKTTTELKPRTKIRLLDASNSEFIATITEIINAKTFTIDTAPEQSGNAIFVYGTYADDFHYINPDTIWTVSLKATKELDEQLQDARATIQSLVQRITELETKLSSKSI